MLRHLVSAYLIRLVSYQKTAKSAQSEQVHPVHLREDHKKNRIEHQLGSRKYWPWELLS